MFQRESLLYDSDNGFSADAGNEPESAERIQPLFVGIVFVLVIPIHFVEDLVTEGGFDVGGGGFGYYCPICS